MNDAVVLGLIEDEIVNTIGCTNIGAFGHIGALIARYTTGTLTKIEMEMSSLVYKNTVNVCIPFCEYPGLDLAVVLGYLMNNADRKLELFTDMNEHVLAMARNMLANLCCEIRHEAFEKPLYIRVIAHTNTETVTICVEDEYDRVALIMRNDLVVYKRDNTDDTKRVEQGFKTVQEIISYALTCDIDMFAKLYEYADVQYENVRRLLAKKDANFGPSDRALSLTEMGYPLHQYIYDASKIRMDGGLFRTYALAGSGNLGIGVFVSARYIAEAAKVDLDITKRAVLMAFLLSVTYKFRTCVASAMCGSALATGFAAAAVASYVKGADPDQICAAINNFIASNFGVLCDGAKLSCGYKVAGAAAMGLFAAQMALDGQVISQVNGVNKPDVNETIRIIAQLNDSFIVNINSGVIPMVDRT